MIGDFQNSRRFKISTYFYVTITGDFELFNTKTFLKKLVHDFFS